MFDSKLNLDLTPFMKARLLFVMDKNDDDDKKKKKKTNDDKKNGE